jgi:hypothetical protein
MRVITRTCAWQLVCLRRRLEKKLLCEGLDRLEQAMLDFLNDLLGREEVLQWLI